MPVQKWCSCTRALADPRQSQSGDPETLGAWDTSLHVGERTADMWDLMLEVVREWGLGNADRSKPELQAPIGCALGAPTPTELGPQNTVYNISLWEDLSNGRLVNAKFSALFMKSLSVLIPTQ